MLPGFSSGKCRVEYIRVTWENTDQKYICGAVANHKVVKVAPGKTWRHTGLRMGRYF